MSIERLGILVCALVALAPGCSPGGKGESARLQYAQVIDALRAGSLARAYETAMPPAYDRDLEAIWAQARALVTEEELGLLKDALRKLGVKAAPLVAFLGESETAKVAAAKLKDLPAALGLTSLAELGALDVKGLLAGFDRGFFAELTRTADFQKRLAGATVRLEAEKGDWARLKFVSQADGGAEETTDVAEVILIDGKWVLDGWVTDWPKQMDEIKARLAELAAAKQQDPDLLKKQLVLLARAADDPGPLLEGLSARLGAVFGGAEPPAEEGKK
jgi:hypothetical protein